MDSLQVTGSAQSSSKSSSRSASPSRPCLSPLLPPSSSSCTTSLSVSPSPSPSPISSTTVLAVSPSTSKTFGRTHQQTTRRNTDTNMHSSTPNSAHALRPSGQQTARRDTSASVNYGTPNARGGPSHQGGSQEALSGGEDESDCQLTPVAAANGSSELLGGANLTAEEEASNTPDIHRARVAYDRLQEKLLRTRQQIKTEQTSRDENVNEYLKLAASADKQQLARIKAVFEKKNQKSAQAIAGLQRKLESYRRRLRELENILAATSQSGSSKASDTSSSHLMHHHRQPREVLRDMGQGLKNVGGNIRDGISGFSGTVMSKPREFAHLIRNKFGSADNINSLGKSSFYTGLEETGSEEDQQSQQSQRIHHGSATLPAQPSHTHQHTGSSGSRFPQGSEEGASECSSATSESLPPNNNHGGEGGTNPSSSSHQHHQQHHMTSPRHVPHATEFTTSSIGLQPIYEELQELREDLGRLRADFDALKINVQGEQQFNSQNLLDEKFRVERLEEQLNDLTELHQTEVENLKTQVADSEEKVQYQSEERLRDIHEMLEACQTKISKMEHQQHQHQQYVTLEGIHNSNARALVVKLINVVLTVLQVVLLLVATVANIAMPFLRTRLRVLTTVLLVAGVVFVVKQWPEVRDVGNHLMRHIKQALAVK